jgi:hypothetical protein
MTLICGGDVKSRTGTGIFLTMYSHTASTLYLSWAEMGTTGAPSAMVPCTKAVIASCWLLAADSEMRSTLFCRMRMCCRRMISTAARCSEVWGWGHDSLAAMSSRAPSMTAAPLSMVAIRMSWPGRGGGGGVGCGRGARARPTPTPLFHRSRSRAARCARAVASRHRGPCPPPSLTRAVDKRHVPQQLHFRPLEPGHIARGRVLLGRPIRAVGPRARARRVGRAIYFGVGVPELDRDVALQLVLEAHGLHAGDGFDDGGFAVGDVADGA